MRKMKGFHQAVPQLKSDLDKGKISGREFLRYATLTGLSVAAASVGGFALPKRALAAEVKRGGTLRIAGPVQKVTHPAQFSWITPTNQLSNFR